MTPETRSADPRDNRPEPPAVLDALLIWDMQAMVKDAGKNGDRPWPYGRAGLDWVGDDE